MNHQKIILILALFTFTYSGFSYAEFRGCKAQYSNNERLEFFGQCVRQGIGNDKCAKKNCCEHLTLELAKSEGVCGYADNGSREKRFDRYTACVKKPEKDTQVSRDCCEHLSEGDINILGTKTKCGKLSSRQRIKNDLKWIEETGDRIKTMFNKWF